MQYAKRLNLLPDTVYAGALGDQTIAAISSTNFNSDQIGVWMIKGKIVRK
jgi:hypothetical protein